jgi:hypothetical protein
MSAKCQEQTLAAVGAAMLKKLTQDAKAKTVPKEEPVV